MRRLIIGDHITVLGGGPGQVQVSFDGHDDKLKLLI